MTKAEKEVLNGLLHKLIELRDKNKCLRCSNPKWQMSHIYPKGRYRSMEFDPDNIKPLCFSCHLGWWHKNPVDAGIWIKGVLSKKRLERLKLMSNTYQGRIDYKLHKLFLENEIKRYH